MAVQDETCDTPSDWVSPKRWLQALSAHWHWLVAGSMVGALILTTVGLVTGGQYRAVSRIMLTYDLERPYAQLNVQTLFLESIAYSDEVWDRVMQQVQGNTLADDMTQEDIREQVSLPHPNQGEWEFVVDDANPDMAASISNAWSQSFVDVLTENIETARREEAYIQAGATYSNQLAEVLQRRERLSLARAAISTLGSDNDVSQQEALADILALLSGLVPLDDVEVVGDTLSEEDTMVIERRIALYITLAEQEYEVLWAQWLESWRRAEAIAYAGAAIVSDMNVLDIREALPPEQPLVPIAHWALIGWALGLIVTSTLVITKTRNTPGTYA